MKARVLTKDRVNVLSSGEVRTTRDGVTFLFEPIEMKTKVLMALQGTNIFALEVGEELHIVSLIDARVERPIKFVMAPAGSEG